MLSYARGLSLGCAVLLCCSACSTVEEIAEHSDAFHPVGPNQNVSQSAVSARTASVAVSDGDTPWPSDTEPQIADVVIGYEQDGVSHWAVAMAPTGPAPVIWQTAGSNNWTPPSDKTSDGYPPNFYEGTPTVLAFNKEHVANPLERTFVYVSKLGTTQNGTKSPAATGSTDVAALVSWDGGQTFHNPRLLTVPPLDPWVRLHVDYPTAAAEGSNLLSTGAFWALWREKPVDGTGSDGTASWKARRVNVDTSSCCANPDYTLDIEGAPSSPIEVPIPKDAGPARIGAVADNGIRVYVVYPTYDDQADVCPGAETVAVTWMLISTSSDSSYLQWTDPEPITEDPAWRKCVGASSEASGTPWNRHIVRPEFAIDPISKALYVAVSKGDGSPASAARVHVLRKLPGSVWETVFETSPTTDPFRHDNWSPAMAQYHYPGEPEGDVGLFWYSTQKDVSSPTKNEYLKLFGTLSEQSGDPGSWEPTDPVEPLGPQQVVDDLLGDYQGLAAHPHVPAGFMATWGDQRGIGPTNVWSVLVNKF